MKNKKKRLTKQGKNRRKKVWDKSVDIEMGKRKNAHPISTKSTSVEKSDYYSERLQMIIAYLEDRNLHEEARQAGQAQTISEIQEWEKFVYARHREEEKEQSQKQKKSIRNNRDTTSSNSQELQQNRDSTSANLQKLRKDIHTILNTKEFFQGTQNLQMHYREVKDFLKGKWEEINSIKRSFGFALEQSYEVIVSIESLMKLGILKIRFRQENFVAPAVGVDFLMQYDVVFSCSLTATGELQTSSELNKTIPSDLHILLRLAVIMYYADLVIPSNDHEFRHNYRSAIQGSSKNKEQVSHHAKSIKLIPRDNSPISPKSSSYNSKTSQHSALIDPFRRRLPKGQKPSVMKIIEADQFGINLQGPGFPEIQYTFVKGHVRGTDDKLHDYVYKQNYSVVKTFETLLSVFGFF